MSSDLFHHCHPRRLFLQVLYVKVDLCSRRILPEVHRVDHIGDLPYSHSCQAFVEAAALDEQRNHLVEDVEVHLDVLQTDSEC